MRHISYSQRLERRELGLCYRCSRPVDTTRSVGWCSDCLDKRNQRLQLKRDRETIKKVCFTCGVELVRGFAKRGISFCYEHRENGYKIYREEIKQQVFEVLGKECAKCGFDDLRALQLDHIIPVKETRMRKTTLRIHKEIIAGSQDYQILCANCNWIKGPRRYE